MNDFFLSFFCFSTVIQKYGVYIFFSFFIYLWDGKKYVFISGADDNADYYWRQKTNILINIHLQYKYNSFVKWNFEVPDLCVSHFMLLYTSTPLHLFDNSSYFSDSDHLMLIGCAMC